MFLSPPEPEPVLYSSGIAPSFTKGPSDIMVTDGAVAVFSCEVSGAPKPAVSWRRGNSHLLAPDQLYEAAAGRAPTAGTAFHLGIYMVAAFLRVCGTVLVVF